MKDACVFPNSNILPGQCYLPKLRRLPLAPWSVRETNHSRPRGIIVGDPDKEVFQHRRASVRTLTDPAFYDGRESFIYNGNVMFAKVTVRGDGGLTLSGVHAENHVGGCRRTTVSKLANCLRIAIHTAIKKRGVCLSEKNIARSKNGCQALFFHLLMSIFGKCVGIEIIPF